MLEATKGQDCGCGGECADFSGDREGSERVEFELCACECGRRGRLASPMTVAESLADGVEVDGRCDIGILSEKSFLSVHIPI